MYIFFSTFAKLLCPFCCHQTLICGWFTPLWHMYNPNMQGLQSIYYKLNSNGVQLYKPVQVLYDQLTAKTWGRMNVIYIENYDFFFHLLHKIIFVHVIANL